MRMLRALVLLQQREDGLLDLRQVAEQFGYRPLRVGDGKVVYVRVQLVDDFSVYAGLAREESKAPGSLSSHGQQIPFVTGDNQLPLADRRCRCAVNGFDFWSPWFEETTDRFGEHRLEHSSGDRRRSGTVAGGKPTEVPSADGGALSEGVGKTSEVRSQFFVGAVLLPQ
jgi:hypothetical protein